MFGGKDSDPPDIKPDILVKNPDTPGKGRISLCRRNSSLHSDSDTKEIKDEDLTSDKNISLIHCKEMNVEYKPDQ